MKVLAGDLGGTHGRLWLAEVDGGPPRCLRETVYPSADYPDPADFIEDFLAGETVASACLAVAGPVETHDDGQTARITNLPWRLDSRKLAERLGLPRLRLINDFAAVGYGIDALQPKDLVTLQPGQPRPQASRVLIGAGTGLGVAILAWDGRRYRVLASEGGHVDFAPTEPLQSELWAWLQARHGHVSAERVLSGPGLVNLYRFLAQRRPEAADPALGAVLDQHDAPARISEHALWRGDALAREAVELFIRIYGAQAGNLALTALAHGGVFLAGGIAPKLLDLLHGGGFIAAFRAKGRMAPLMEEFPVQVIINTRVGLLGAARVAAHEVNES